MSFDEWKKVKINELCSYSNEKIAIEKLNLLNYISTENMLPNKNGITKASSLPNTGKATKFHRGDILVSNIRPYFKKIWFANKDGGSSNDVLVFKNSNPNQVDNKYLYYNFVDDKFFNYVVAGSKGTKMPRGDKEAILNYEIYKPPLDVQQKIAFILSALDEKIELNNRMNKVLEQIAQAIFKQWFVDFEFPNENGEPYKSSGGEMEWCEELGKEIPKGWRVGTVSDLGTVVGGGTPSSTKEEFYADLGIPWITPKDLSMNKNKFIYRGSRDITEAGLKNSAAKLMPEGTVLFTSRAPIGYIAIAGNSVTTNQGFKSIIPNDEVGTEFVYCFLKENLSAIENMATGSTFKEISGNVLKNIPALLPEPNLIKQFSEIVKIHNDKIKNSEKQIDYLSSLRDTLLPKLMSGEIDVSEIEL